VQSHLWSHRVGRAGADSWQSPSFCSIWTTGDHCTLACPLQAAVSSSAAPLACAAAAAAVWQQSTFSAALILSAAKLGWSFFLSPPPQYPSSSVSLQGWCELFQRCSPVIYCHFFPTFSQSKTFFVFQCRQQEGRWIWIQYENEQPA